MENGRERESGEGSRRGEREREGEESGGGWGTREERGMEERYKKKRVNMLTC